MMSKQVPAEQLAHSQNLVSKIQADIERNGGWIAFDAYMAAALYTPNLGYYAGGSQKFGADGDFVTAPELGDLFGQSLASQIVEVFGAIDEHAILEFGAGTGALAATVLNSLAAQDALPLEYLILEVSNELRARQQLTIERLAPKFCERVKWLDALPATFSGVVIANEVLDAMPVKIFEQDPSAEILEVGVSLSDKHNPEDAFCWRLGPAEPALREAVKHFGIINEGESYRSEVHHQAQAWVQSLGQILKQGAVMLIDYGFAQHEYYHPDRRGGTLMCHYRHRAHENPFFLPGLQDITAHVNFSAVARSAHLAGLDILGYATQGAFLLSTGLLNRLPIDLPTQAQIELAQEIKKLSLPHEMGELFKVMVLGKELELSLSGFDQQDMRTRL